MKERDYKLKNSNNRYKEKHALYGENFITYNAELLIVT